MWNIVARKTSPERGTNDLWATFGCTRCVAHSLREDALSRASFAGFCSIVALAASAVAVGSDPLPPDTTYRPLPTMPLSEARTIDEAQKSAVMERQRAMLEARYDLGDRAMPGVMMSGGLKPVQDGVRVRLPEGQTWEALAALVRADPLDFCSRSQPP